MTMTMLRIGFRQRLIAALLLLAPLASHATVLCSWNVKRLQDEQSRSFPAMAAVMNVCDFVAAQEIIDVDGAQRLLRNLQAHDPAWEVLMSHPIGRGQYKEIYGFYFRTTKVNYLDKALVYLDPGDVFSREPFSARFRTREGVVFAAANVHILYGKSEADRLPEIARLEDYWKFLEDSYPQDRSRLMLMGDFNLAPSNPMFGGLRSAAKPLLTTKASTLSLADQRFANLLDNIWVNERTELPILMSGVLEYTRYLITVDGTPISHKVAREYISDHAPVYVTLSPDNFDPDRLKPLQLLR